MVSYYVTKSVVVNYYVNKSNWALINAIISNAGLTDAKVKTVPAKVSELLQAYKIEPTFRLDFNYHSIVGKLNYLAQTTHPDIM